MKNVNKLGDLLAEMPDERRIKLGAESGFFFIGACSVLKENYAAYDKKIIAYWKELTERWKAKYYAKRDTPPSTLSFLKRSNVKSADLEKLHEGYVKFVEEHAKQLRKLYNSWKTADKHRKQLKHLMDRVVLETYPGDPIVDDAQIIIVEGFEPGPLWLRSEAEELGPFYIAQVREEENDDE